MLVLYSLLNERGSSWWLPHLEVRVKPSLGYVTELYKSEGWKYECNARKRDLPAFQFAKLKICGDQTSCRQHLPTLLCYHLFLQGRTQALHWNECLAEAPFKWRQHDGTWCWTLLQTKESSQHVKAMVADSNAVNNWKTKGDKNGFQCEMRILPVRPNEGPE